MSDLIPTTRNELVVYDAKRKAQWKENVTKKSKEDMQFLLKAVDILLPAISSLKYPDDRERLQELLTSLRTKVKAIGEVLESIEKEV